MCGKEPRDSHWFYRPNEEPNAEWLSWRSKGIGGTDAVVLAGLSPWKTIQELFEEKTTGKSLVKENWAMKRGKDLEPFARDIYEFQTGHIAPPKNVEHKEFSFVRASLDGFCEKENIVVEIKSPGRNDLNIAIQNKIPIKYYPQVQWQLLITGAHYCDYVTYDGREKIFITKVENDFCYQRALLRLAKWFWNRVQENRPVEKYGVSLKTKRALEIGL